MFSPLRLFRLFKLFKIGDLKVLADAMTRTISSILNYVILLFLFMYIMNLLGMQLFAGELKFDA